MSVWFIVGAAALLSVERLAYAWIWRSPSGFQNLCAQVMAERFREPIAALRLLFVSFKAVQAGVFIGWCYVYGRGSLWPVDASLGVVAVGLGVAIVGQILNFGVFYRLGEAGVFYGNRFGHDVPWCSEFPFSLCDDPQYVGAVLSIWGFFLVMRFPHADWFMLPALETVYYVLGARLER